MALIYEIIVTIIYWSVLHPKLDLSEYGILVNICLRTDHSIPFGLLFIDFWLNSCEYELKHLWIEMPVLLFYGMVNFISTKKNDVPVYPPMSWDSFVSVSIALAFLPLLAILALLMKYLSNCKHRHFNSRRLKEHQLSNE